MSSLCCPAIPGCTWRRAFYWLTLKRSTLNCFIGFGALLFHRQTQIERGVYVGPYAVVGTASLKTGCLIGTRANLLSGAEQHELREDGRWSPSDVAKFRQIEIGEHACRLSGKGSRLPSKFARFGLYFFLNVRNSSTRTFGARETLTSLRRSFSCAWRRVFRFYPWVSRSRRDSKSRLWQSSRQKLCSAVRGIGRA